CAGRRLLEHEPHTSPCEHPRRIRQLGQVEDGGQLVGGEVVDLEQVPHANAFATSVTASSSSSSVTSSDGARRRAVSLTGLTTSPSSSRRSVTPLASPAVSS